MPSRVLSSEKIVKGGRRGKEKNEVFNIDYAEPRPVF